MKKTVLLTGASGFIGGRLLQELLCGQDRDDFEVVAVSSKTQNGCKTVIHRNGILPKEALREAGVDKIDVVVHAGAFTPKNRAQSEDQRNNGNVTFTDALLQALPAGVGSVVFLSSLDVYAPSEKAITEDSTVGPTTLYGWSKLYGEKMVGAWARANGARSHVLRIGHIYGPGESMYDKLIPNTIKSVAAGSPPVLWNGGSEKRSFLYIDDCVSAILSLLKMEFDHDLLVNIASNEPVMVSEVVSSILTLMGTPVETVNKLTDSPARDILFDNSLMRRVLYTPRTGFIEGLKMEIAHFRSGS